MKLSGVLLPKAIAAFALPLTSVTSAVGGLMPYLANSAGSSVTIAFICADCSFEMNPSIAPKSPRASTGAFIRHSPLALTRLTSEPPWRISMRSTLSRSKLMIFLVPQIERRAVERRLQVAGDERNTFLSPAVFAYMSLPVGVLVPIWSVLNSLAPLVLKLTSATDSRNP